MRSRISFNCSQNATEILELVYVIVFFGFRVLRVHFPNSMPLGSSRSEVHKRQIPVCGREITGVEGLLALEQGLRYLARRSGDRFVNFWMVYLL
jgi:hypothetical protein